MFYFYVLILQSFNLFVLTSTAWCNQTIPPPLNESESVTPCDVLQVYIAVVTSEEFNQQPSSISERGGKNANVPIILIIYYI